MFNISAKWPRGKGERWTTYSWGRRAPKLRRTPFMRCVGNFYGHVVPHRESIQARSNVNALQLGAPSAESLEAIPREAHAKCVPTCSSRRHLEGVIELAKVVAGNRQPFSRLQAHAAEEEPLAEALGAGRDGGTTAIDDRGVQDQTIVVAVLRHPERPASFIPGEISCRGQVEGSTGIPLLKQGPELTTIHMGPSPLLAWRPV